MTSLKFRIGSQLRLPALCKLMILLFKRITHTAGGSKEEKI
jgi:hypothetical protein